MSEIKTWLSRLEVKPVNTCDEIETAMQAEIDDLHPAWENAEKENTRLKELLEQTRGSVKKDWIGWEQYQIRKSKEGFTSYQDGSAECTRLFNLLEAIDAIIEKEGIK